MVQIIFWWEWDNSNIASDAIDKVRIVTVVVVVGLGEVTCYMGDIAITPMVPHFVLIS